MRSGSLVLLCAALGACTTNQPAVPVATGGGVLPRTVSAVVAFTGVAWDSFNHRAARIWACRDIERGEVVPNSLCHGVAQVDRQWPGTLVPPSYRGVSID